jgi:hypothetical protein
MGAKALEKAFATNLSQDTWKSMQAFEAALGLGAHGVDIERICQILREDKLIPIGHSFLADSEITSSFVVNWVYYGANKCPVNE